MDVAIVGDTHVAHQHAPIDFDLIRGAHHDVMTGIVRHTHTLAPSMPMPWRVLDLLGVLRHVACDRLGGRHCGRTLGRHVGMPPSQELGTCWPYTSAPVAFQVFW